MPSPPALRAAKALAASGKPKQGQTTEDQWARIIDRETGVADLLVACEAALFAHPLDFERASRYENDAADADPFGTSTYAQGR